MAHYRAKNDTECLSRIRDYVALIVAPEETRSVRAFLSGPPLGPFGLPPLA